eukprot:TRINITY_DN1852_c0_g1_i7.p1 TRINITY_DN1852_c0_g1~~TRINITY_DN1852_c0_g1_i7.p1  ORF type:complete len:277 (+),score=-6.81 TRINITY_DN1852_c0_g1_i7:483-1313(+)
MFHCWQNQNINYYQCLFVLANEVIIISRHKHNVDLQTPGQRKFYWKCVGHALFTDTITLLYIMLHYYVIYAQHHSLTLKTLKNLLILNVTVRYYVIYSQQPGAWRQKTRKKLFIEILNYIHVQKSLQMQQQSICCNMCLLLTCLQKVSAGTKIQQIQKQFLPLFKVNIKTKSQPQMQTEWYGYQKETMPKQKVLCRATTLKLHQLDKCKQQQLKVKKQACIDNMNNIQTTIIICKSNKLSLLEKEFNDYITVDPRQSQQYLGRRFFKPFGPINSIG